jgi:hypothetical protein
VPSAALLSNCLRKIPRRAVATVVNYFAKQIQLSAGQLNVDADEVAFIIRDLKTVALHVVSPLGLLNASAEI